MLFTNSESTTVKSLPSTYTAPPVSAVLFTNVAFSIVPSFPDHVTAPPLSSDLPLIKVMLANTTSSAVIFKILDIPLASIVCPLPLIVIALSIITAPVSSAPYT